MLIIHKLYLHRNYLANSTSLLWAKVQRLVLLPLVEFPQIFLLLLVHHNVDAGDGLPDHADLGQLGGSATSNLNKAGVN